MAREASELTALAGALWVDWAILPAPHAERRRVRAADDAPLLVPIGPAVHGVETQHVLERGITQAQRGQRLSSSPRRPRRCALGGVHAPLQARRPTPRGGRGRAQVGQLLAPFLDEGSGRTSPQGAR